ncbi:hypothetical protein P3342_001555 [Pyrenophora teres f. teres]|uniref:Uncharacterized protein n=2 Tax=Pyrenophora teres f. teres TaxID=97479 RepID=E3RFE6_PYRTT|nr:hypothetical protein PTT_06193 [Pyrenophora teres f. teres 0-1]KAE8822621.1 hypothetical protein HRS9139_09961 [Pyrenophora teres f. teres]KAE8826249.1 hypothetical protein PTNB85_09194 [Pyrenophora teres f. teres]KAE8832738.1 hypothetical protein HRS9122_08451 [Pyrenophora teres f. teres]KAE8852691.1 hypothetical protein PTNB29_10081 [Pyrenophora teres f. teres]
MAAQGTYSHDITGYEYLEDEPEPLREREVSIVKIAGVIQNALDQKVDQELANQGETSCKHEQPIIRAVGYVAGEIVELGPDYSSFVGSPSEVQDWTSCWARQYKNDEEVEIVRGVGEEYEARILDYQHEDLARIHALDHPQILAGRRSNGYGDPEPIRKPDMETKMAHNMGDNCQMPRICLATGYVMGLVPPTAQVGDVLIRFWGYDAAVLMRPIDSVQDPYFTLIGRADLACSIAREKAMHASHPNSWKLPLWESDWILPGATEHSHLPGAVYINLDFRTLQKITAYTKPYNHWTPPEREQPR